ncbi:unnamed protein product [Dimorphilus gyrociliatus]|uniref:C2H2-type domain-containing protein n=1 Tax=Dimorphilus gyrociliatus TaxID=2664684 RepID=A0A7I8WCF1_9ANNE|nr:unnamed protein product [Dimorphilus gyrociliatus]
MPRALLFKRSHFRSWRKSETSEEDSQLQLQLLQCSSPDSGYGKSPCSDDISPLSPVHTTPSVRTAATTPPQSSLAKKKGKSKVCRKLQFETSSPVSGTIIRSIDDPSIGQIVSGDIDTNLNWVSVTAEARAELARIENKLGDYTCQLCREKYTDAFDLAQHRCSCIVHVEYKCPECDKVFNCPANLASHRRWHRPKQQQTTTPSNQDDQEAQFECSECGKKFRRAAYLRKHSFTHSTEPSSGSSYACPTCGRLFKTTALRDKHAVSAHSTQPPWIRSTSPGSLIQQVCDATFNQSNLFHCC